MKTTSVDFLNSIVPGVVSMRTANRLKTLKKDDSILTEVEELLLSDTVFQQFISFFNLTEINPQKLIRAFSHSSFINEYQVSQLNSYERLELLGDSVLELIITENLFDNFPTLSEGALSKLRGQFVSKDELANLGELIGLSHFVLVGRGEYQQKVYEKKSIYADIFESLIGVVYTELGLDGAKTYLNKVFNEYEKKFGVPFISVARVEGKNYKGRLQEIVMKDYNTLPKYTDVELDSGEFLVTVAVEERLLGKSIDKSKKQAQINAAKGALKKLTHQKGKTVC